MALQAEFQALALPQADALYRTALRMTKETSAAEDLVQEAYLKAYRNFGSFERGTNFRAWIFRILANTYINSYRRHALEPVITDFAEVEPADPEEAAALSARDVGALKEKLGDEAKKALEKVPPEFRLIFLMATFEDMSYKEIAEIMELPIGTVMSRLFRARKTLREELASFARQSGFLKGGGDS